MKDYDNNWNDQAKTWAEQTIANEQHESRMLKEFELEQQYGNEFRAWKKERNHKKVVWCLVTLIIIGAVVSVGLWVFDPLGGEQSQYEPAQEKVEKANQDIQKELQESATETQQEEYEDTETAEDVEQYVEEANATTESASEATETTETPKTEENHQMGDYYVPAHFEENKAVLEQWQNLGGEVSGCVEARTHDCMMKGHHLVITDTSDAGRLKLGRPVPETYPILFCDDCAQEGQFEPVIAALDN